jgi:hypothetical protein
MVSVVGADLRCSERSATAQAEKNKVLSDLPGMDYFRVARDPGAIRTEHIVRHSDYTSTWISKRCALRKDQFCGDHFSSSGVLRLKGLGVFREPPFSDQYLMRGNGCFPDPV